MNLVVFLDGTWNDPADNTNIFQLYERTVAFDRSSRRQLRYYDEGVGARSWERIPGGLFGWGIDANLRDAYRFLASRYEPGDRIYLFGFSRGATTVRSLAAMITHSGLIHPDDLPAQQVLRRYRKRKRVPGLLEMHGSDHPRNDEDELVLQRSRCARIHFIGVFDTVGSLGVPGGALPWVSRWRYGFHDTSLSGLNDHAYQALAVDEHRRDFKATMWTAPPPRVDCPAEHGAPPCADVPEDRLSIVEQRWYAGAHGNVGGGGATAPQESNPLSILAREWIAQKAGQAGLELEPAEPGSGREALGREWRGPISDSYGTFIRGVYRRIWRRHFRPMGETINEMLAPELVQRYGAFDGYRPQNPGFPRIPVAKRFSDSLESAALA